MVRVAIATEDGSTISGGHFAHSRRFAIYSLKEGRLLELRDNPLASVPDLDVEGTSIHGAGGLHGRAKYEWLRREVLSDVDVVVAGGACMTSIVYFTSSGVRLVFTMPGTRGEEVLGALRSAGEIPLLGIYEDGRIVDAGEE